MYVCMYVCMYVYNIYRYAIYEQIKQIAYLAYKHSTFVLNTFYTLWKQIINIYKDDPKIIVEHFFSKLCLKMNSGLSYKYGGKES